MLQHSNRLQLETQVSQLDWTGLSFTMTQDLRTLALFLAMIFHGGMDRDGTLGTQTGHFFDFTLSTQIHLSTRLHFHLRVPPNAFSPDTKNPTSTGNTITQERSNGCWRTFRSWLPACYPSQTQPLAISLDHLCHQTHRVIVALRPFY